MSWVFKCKILFWFKRQFYLNLTKKVNSERLVLQELLVTALVINIYASKAMKRTKPLCTGGKEKRFSLEEANRQKVKLI